MLRYLATSSNYSSALNHNERQPSTSIATVASGTWHNPQTCLGRGDSTNTAILRYVEQLHRGPLLFPSCLQAWIHGDPSAILEECLEGCSY